MIEDDLNNVDEDNEIDEDTKGYPIEEVNDAESTVTNYRPSRESAGTDVNKINISFDGKSYGKYVHSQLLMKE